MTQKTLYILFGLINILSDYIKSFAKKTFILIRHMLINIIWSNLCLICNKEVELSQDLFCHNCSKAISLSDNKLKCIICGKKTTQKKCLYCQNELPYISDVGSVFIYNKKSNKLISQLKYHDNSKHLKQYAKLMVENNLHILNQIDLIIPVPILRIKLIIRKFNQSALISTQISKITGIPIKLHLLKRRIKFRRRQAKLSRKDRLTLNYNSFFMGNGDKDIQHKRILLIDDVVTTGATGNACAKTLINNGAKEVRLLTLMKTPKHSHF